ncbi:2-methylaconitate cis-trans isomerase PrpF [Sinorhizobium meliloti]|uniref:2-methylaconitate cis-trans isomerase PrpF n=1 Tax=Rhizobium meliloti TaxID=382 RepID=A0A2J0YTP1_RHIML|nr:2-methylaconitate cis-trans isomerase PrpF [Sinorhizobium meliloti]PJR09669.1 2-methylaconitate cis-trans isomerase PrpF [Sinorhizobium meliloti]
MTRRRIPAVLMRGGTSKGLFVRLEDLPSDLAVRDRVLLRAFGSPDPYGRQMDGVGGGHSSASKVAVISRSKRPGCDIDYLFGQVAVDRALIDWSGSCGNLLSAAASFAIDEGFVDVPSEGIATVRIWQVNLGQQIVARVPVQAGQTAETGLFEMDGVAFPGAEILIEYPPQDNADGGLFPTGRVLDRVEVPGIGRFDVTLLQAGMATAIVEARVLGLAGTELPEHINGNDELLERLEMIRAACAVAMGLAKTPQEATQTRPHMPKLAFVSPSIDYRASNGQVIGATSVDLVARIISMGKLHHAITGTGAAAIAAALQVPGTVPHRLAQTRSRKVRLGHASGILTVEADVSQTAGTFTADRLAMSRSARRLMEGWVCTPGEFWPQDESDLASIAR